MCALRISKANHLIGHQNPVYALAVDAEQNAFFSGGNDRGIVRWHLDAPAFDQVLCPVEHTVYALHRLPGTRKLFAALRDGAVILTDTEKGGQLDVLRLHSAPVFALGSLVGKQAGPELVVGAEDGSFSIWNVKGKAELLLRVQVSASPIRSLCISPDEKWICFGTKDGKVHVYAASDFSMQGILDAHSLPVTALMFSPNGQFLFTSGRDAQMMVFEVDGPSGAFLKHSDFVPHMFAIYSMQFHPELPIFATASRDKSIKLWSAENFSLLRSISIEKGWEAHRLSVNALCWQPDGKRLFTTGDDKVIMAWDVKGSL